MIGKIAKDVRNSLSVKQEEFAYKLGISREYYSKIENGKVEPNAQLTVAIIDAIRHFLVVRTNAGTADTTFKAALEICNLLQPEHKAQMADALTMKKS